MDCFIVQYNGIISDLCYGFASLSRSGTGDLYKRKRRVKGRLESGAEFIDVNAFRELDTARQFYIRIKYAGDISPI